MSMWDTIKRFQETAEHHGFGNEWRAFCETRTLEAAKAAHFKTYRTRLGVEDDAETAEELDDMYMYGFYLICNMKRKALQ